jgi:6,7-dimethyl-8-ribityllumazine synthase
MNQTPATSLHAVPATPRGVADAIPGPAIAVISASWHADIVGQARRALLAGFERAAAPPRRVDCFDVPGAFEIPLLARRLAASGRYDAVVACALVVNGGIYRHEFVATAVIDGLMRAQLDTDVPVLSCVLTPRDFHEHEDHRHFFGEHFVKKGAEVAHACLATVAGLRAAGAALAA